LSAARESLLSLAALSPLDRSAAMEHGAVSATRAPSAALTNVLNAMFTVRLHGNDTIGSRKGQSLGATFRLRARHHFIDYFAFLRRNVDPDQTRPGIAQALIRRAQHAHVYALPQGSSAR
jgi:hypothetical protein